MGEEFHLSSLNEFLQRILIFTEEVKFALTSDCNEATYSLKPWRVETVVTKEITENDCVCPKITPENEAEEIAASINRVLLQTQQFREKLSLNTAESKKLKNPYANKIYSSRHAIGKTAANPTLLSQKSKTSNLKTKCKEAKDRQSVKSEIKKSSQSTQKSTASIVHKSSLKAKTEKNYLAINKLSVRDTKQSKTTNEEKQANPKSSSVVIKNPDKRYSAASTSELQNLIQKLTLESNTRELDSDRIKSNCPVHGTVQPKYVQEQNIVTMDLVESLDKFCIPGEMIKALKLYHSYLKSEFSSEVINRDKRQKSVNKFLAEFDKMNENMQPSLQREPELISLLSRLTLLLQDANVDASLIPEDEIKQIDTQINSISKLYDLREFDETQTRDLNPKRKLLYDIDNSGWLSMGIWYRFNAAHFKEMSKASCVRYLNKEQLISFFETMQQLQRTQYLNQLIDIILRDVIPSLITNFDPTNSEHIDVYKMICILRQGLNPRIPILVQTDK